MEPRVRRTLLLRALKPGRDRTALSLAGLCAASLLLAGALALLCLRLIVIPARDSRGAVMALRKEGSLFRDSLTVPGFSQADIEWLRARPGVRDLAAVRSAAFQIQAGLSLGGGGFSSLIFVESVPDGWLEEPLSGRALAADPEALPVLVGETFLFIYNSAFAPSYGLPELKGAYLSMIPIDLDLVGAHGSVRLRARVVGTTSLMDSILVPEGWLAEQNRRLSGEEEAAPRKLLVRLEPERAADFAQACKKRGLRVERNALLGTALASFLGMAGIILTALAAFAVIQAAGQFLMGLEMETRDAEAALAALRLWGHEADALASIRLGRLARLIGASLGLSLASIALALIFMPATLRTWLLPLPMGAALLGLVLVHAAAYILARRSLREEKSGSGK